MESDYFIGFKWPLPKSFADALSKCLFEVGDIIYDTPKAYSLSWNDARNIIKNSIQIKSISAINIFPEDNNNESTFSENWDSEVVFDFYYYPSLEKKEIKSTQGRLYSFLWKGDDRYILTKSSPVEKPIMLKKVFKNNSDYQFEITKKVNPKSDFIFYFPIDVANEQYNEKTQKIIRSFKHNSNSITYNLKSYTLQELNLNLAINFCPTIQFMVFEIDGSSTVINEALKSALYTPSKNKKSDKEYFRLKSHGILLQNN